MKAKLRRFRCYSIDLSVQSTLSHFFTKMVPKVNILVKVSDSLSGKSITLRKILRFYTWKDKLRRFIFFCTKYLLHTKYLSHTLSHFCIKRAPKSTFWQKLSDFLSEKSITLRKNITIMDIKRQINYIT